MSSFSRDRLLWAFTRVRIVESARKELLSLRDVVQGNKAARRSEFVPSLIVHHVPFHRSGNSISVEEKEEMQDDTLVWADYAPS